MKIAVVLIAVAGIMPALPRDGSGPGIATPVADLAPDIAQRAILIEENSKTRAVAKYSGSVRWSRRTVSYLPDQPAQPAAHAEIEIPAKKIRVSWDLMRNANKMLPVSHTIEIVFKRPASVAIAEVPGVLVAPTEDGRGTPLSGLSVKMITNYFIIGLSENEKDIQRNMRLLAEQAWIDIPFVYVNDSRAILRFGEGAIGHRILTETIAPSDR